MGSTSPTALALSHDTVLERNRAAVLARIERACRAAGRDPGDVRLLAVTKSVSASIALDLARLGQTALAENRVPSLEPKAAALEAAGVTAEWHFVGHVQRNKARRVVRLAHVIHSVDSLALLETLERVAGEEGRRPSLYLQVHASGEEEKYGFPDAATGELLDAAHCLAEAQHLTGLGLMGMAPRRLEDGRDGERARAAFDAVARLAGALPAGAFASAPGSPDRPTAAPRLSLGMSADLEEAVAAGSTCVRIGRALFEGLTEDAA